MAPTGPPLYPSLHTVIRFDKTDMLLYLDDLPLLGSNECPRRNSEMFQNPRVFEVNFIPNNYIYFSFLI
jgi:hypothetical protein